MGKGQATSVHTGCGTVAAARSDRPNHADTADTALISAAAAAMVVALLIV